MNSCDWNIDVTQVVPTLALFVWETNWNQVTQQGSRFRSTDRWCIYSKSDLAMVIIKEVP